MIPEHLARYAHPRVDALELLNDVRKYADPVGEWELHQYQHEMKRIYNAVNAAIGMLGGELKPRKPYGTLRPPASPASGDPRQGVAESS
jgi:hypothetical protein